MFFLAVWKQAEVTKLPAEPDNPLRNMFCSLERREINAFTCGWVLYNFCKSVMSNLIFFRKSNVKIRITHHIVFNKYVSLPPKFLII